MGLSAVVIGWVGTSLTSVAGGVLSSAVIGGIATVVGGAISGAIIGAAIGGLSAAVMGGDIEKGILTGAVGGAIGGALIGGWSVATKGGEGAFTASQASRVADANAVKSGGNLEITGKTMVDGVETVTYGKPEASFMGMSGDTLDMAGQTLSGAASGLLGKSDGIDIDDQTAAQLALQKQAQEAAAKEGALGRTASMEQLQAQLGTQLATTEANISEQRRQYDVSATAAAARQRDAGTGRGVLTIGQGTESTAGYDPALRNVLDNELYTNVAKG